ncbi:MAG: hypothetical protein JO202_01270 [Ktedonobacteraceae bacterium]|nr:hypothetical protein [Ktedonobacteraceae bacterium]
MVGWSLMDGHPFMGVSLLAAALLHSPAASNDGTFVVAGLLPSSEKDYLVALHGGALQRNCYDKLCPCAKLRGSDARQPQPL